MKTLLRGKKNYMFALFLLVAFTEYACSLENTGNALFGLKVSGELVDTYRVSTVGEQSLLPYHSAYYLKLNFNLEPVSGLNISLTLFPQNKRFSDAYYLNGEMDFRLFFEYLYKEGELQLKARYGDLGKIKIGEGLTFDEIYSEGGRLDLQYGKLGFMFITTCAGLTSNEDLYAVNLNYSGNILGTTFFYIPFTAFDAKSQYMISLHGRIPLLELFSFYGEYVYMENKYTTDSSSAGACIGFDLKISDTLQVFSLRNELRGYGEYFNDFYLGYFKVYQGQDTEDRRINNWISYITGGSRLLGGYLNLSYERKILEQVWFKGSIEYLRIARTLSLLDFRGAETIKNLTFYSIGMEWRVNSNFELSLAFTNKCLPDESGYLNNSDMYIDWRHILMQARVHF